MCHYFQTFLRKAEETIRLWYCLKERTADTIISLYDGFDWKSNFEKLCCRSLKLVLQSCDYGFKRKIILLTKSLTTSFHFYWLSNVYLFFPVPPILPIDLPILKDQAMTKSSIEYIHTICLEWAESSFMTVEHVWHAYYAYYALHTT